MRITDSICTVCKYFEHECNVPVGDDYTCFEYCLHPDKKIVEYFYDSEEDIKDCPGFEKF